MSPSPFIVTLTMNPTLDKSTLVGRVMPDKKLRCEAPQWHPGGGGINVARVIARLNGKPLALITKGGSSGEMLVQLLQAEAVNCQAVPIHGRNRGALAVREKSSHQQFRFNFPGPELAEHEWQAVLNRLRALDPQPDYLVLSGGLPPGVPVDFYARVIAQSTGARIILDTSGEPLRAAVDAGVYLLKPNLHELRALTGQPLEDEAAQTDALMTLVNTCHCQAVVLSLGAAGALLATEEGTRHLRAPTVTIRSKVGAGDSMVGGITWKLAQGGSLHDAAQFGIAAGAAAVTTPGSELCLADDVWALYKQIN